MEPGGVGLPTVCRPSQAGAELVDGVRTMDQHGGCAPLGGLVHTDPQDCVVQGSLQEPEELEPGGLAATRETTSGSGPIRRHLVVRSPRCSGVRGSKTRKCSRCWWTCPSVVLDVLRLAGQVAEVYLPWHILVVQIQEH